MNGHELRRHFQELNAKYFSGRLPSYHVRVINRVTWLNLSGRIARRRRLIEIQKGTDDPIGTLLHEMVHAATNDFHAKAFTAELRRMVEAGARVSVAERNSLEHCPKGHPTRMSRQEIRDHFCNALMDRPALTFHQVVSWIIRTYGGPPNVAEFSRQNPWALASFDRCKKACLEERRQAEEFFAKVRAAEIGA